MLKRGGGVCGPPMALVCGGRMNQLLVQVEEGGPRPCGVEGESLVEVWRGGKVLVALERAPLQKGAPFARRERPCGGGTRPCCLLDRQGLKPLQEVW